MTSVTKTLLGPAMWMLLLLLVAGSKAQGGVETHEFSVEPGGHLTVDAPRGTVRVRGTSQNEAASLEGEPAGTVRVEIRRRGLPPMTRIQVRQDGDDILVRGHSVPLLHHLPPWSWRQVRIDVVVPANFKVDLATRGGGIEVRDLTGEVEAKSSGGGLAFRDIVGTIRGRTAGGRVEVDHCHGEVDVRTGGGRIEVDDLDGNLVAATAGGRIDVSDIAGDVEVRTLGGRIEALEVNGELTARSAGGRIRARFDGAPAGDLETTGGSIDVTFPPNFGADLDARALGGRVNVDYAAINNEGERLRLRTIGGAIRVHAAPGEDDR